MYNILINNVYLDAVIHSKIGLLSAVESAGRDRMLFGNLSKIVPVVSTFSNGVRHRSSLLSTA